MISLSTELPKHDFALENRPAKKSKGVVSNGEKKLIERKNTVFNVPILQLREEWAA